MAVHCPIFLLRQAINNKIMLCSLGLYQKSEPIRTQRTVIQNFCKNEEIEFDMKKTIIQHNGNTYEVTAKFGKGQVKLTVNGVSCGRVQACSNHVYAVQIPHSEGKLMILLYFRKIFLFDIEPGTDIVKFSKEKVRINLSIISKIITILALIFFLLARYGL